MYPVSSEAQMAEFTTSPQGGNHAFSTHPQGTSTQPGNTLITMANMAGAALSLALIVGVGIWGYNLLSRDVSGIPVVRAAEGEMRVRPEDPGGQLAQHTGLSVNAVAADGAAAQPADELRLAPQAVDLEEEDQVMAATMVASEPQAEQRPAVTVDVAAALESGDVDALVVQLTDGVTPLTEVTADVQDVVASVTEAVAQAQTEAQEVRVAAVVPTGPGLHRSLRPRKRPTREAVVTPASLPAAEVSPNVDVDAASLPAGTRLAQLGAFDSEEVAREQWGELSRRFDDYLRDKKRIIQKATSGGRVFYRLRAMGFEDIADARRFCSALVAQNADCIPVVTR